MDDPDKVWTFGPGILSTPERWRARFNYSYVCRDNFNLFHQVKPQPEDYQAFREAFPTLGTRLDGMTSQASISTYSAGTGAVAGTIAAARWVRSPVLIALTTVVSGMTACVVGSDIGSWIYGTYKYDGNAVNTSFLNYVRDHRRPTADPSPTTSA